MVTRSGRILRMTAVGDSFIGRIIGSRLTFKGTGLFLGDKLSVVDINNTPVADHYVTNVNEDITLLDTGRRIFCNGLKVLAMPNGTCQIEMFLD